MARHIPSSFRATVELAPAYEGFGSREKYEKKMFAWQLALDRMKPVKPKFNAVRKLTVEDED